MTYTDPYSAKKDALRDLTISFDEHIVAANSKRLGKLREGDYVIVCASSKKTCSSFVAVIIERVEEPFRNWYEEGGNIWTYNFRINPLTRITDVSLHSELRDHMDGLLERAGVNKKNLFHSRFCSPKLLPGLYSLLEEGMFEAL